MTQLHCNAANIYGVLAPELLREQVEKNKHLLAQVQTGSIWHENWLGWFKVDESVSKTELQKINETADYVRKNAQVLIVIGIGGSNRGALSVIHALKNSSKNAGIEVFFAGDTLSASSLSEAIEKVKTHSVMLNVIAKDFNTVEPGITFRILRSELEKKYGDSYKNRVIATGSFGAGQLHELSVQHGWRFLEFPQSVPGRFSVLTAVGLFPMACAGISVEKLLLGARETENYLKSTELLHNPAVQYAVSRNALFEKDFCLESLVFFEPRLIHFARWWSQLFAESEGKTDKALFPLYFSYSEDLHAVGQYVQQGRRNIIETYLKLFFKSPTAIIPASKNVKDGFDYLNQRPFDDLNHAVYEAALHAHSHDRVPCFELEAGEICEETFGMLFYFFMFSCYMSASLLGVNPFTQDGVEAYKRAMYNVLGK